MATWNSIIDDALRKLGKIASGGAGSTQERTDAVAELNRMFGRWSAELGPIYFQTTDSLTWTAGQASRTIGTSGNFDTARPQQLILAQYRDAANVDTDIAIITHDEYQQIQDKTSEATYPLAVAYNPTFGSSLGTLFIYPILSASLTFRLTSLKPLSTITDQTATITLPPGYEDAIVWNLAERLAGEYGAADLAYIMDQARESKRAIQQINEVRPSMWPDPMIPGLGGCERDPVVW